MVLKIILHLLKPMVDFQFKFRFGFHLWFFWTNWGLVSFHTWVDFNTVWFCLWFLFLSNLVVLIILVCGIIRFLAYINHQVSPVAIWNLNFIFQCNNSAFQPILKYLLNYKYFSDSYCYLKISTYQRLWKILHLGLNLVLNEYCLS